MFAYIIFPRSDVVKSLLMLNTAATSVQGFVFWNIIAYLRCPN